MSVDFTDDEMDEIRTTSSSVQERVKNLRDYCQADWTAAGVVLQASGRRCFTVSLPQEIQNFDAFCAGLRARGGALDLSLGTDAMLCTIWDAGSVPTRRAIKRAAGQNVNLVRLIALVLIVAAVMAVTAVVGADA
jgi:hypothetical protein